MSKILPNAVCLMTMTDDEIREELLKDIYNDANLREMIRRLAKLAMDYAKIIDYYKEQIIEHKNVIKNIKHTIDELE